MISHRTVQLVNLALAGTLVFSIALTVSAVTQVRDIRSEAARAPKVYSDTKPYNGICAIEAGRFLVSSGTIAKNSSTTIKFSSCLSQTQLSLQLYVDTSAKIGGVTIQITKPDGTLYTGPSQGALFRPSVPDGQWSVLLTNTSLNQSVSYNYYLSVLQL